MQNDECINPGDSLVELYHTRSTIRAKIKVADFVGNTALLNSLNAEYKEVTTKIKSIENVGYNGGGVIRLV